MIFLFVFARSTLMTSTIALNSGLLASALLRGTFTIAIAVRMALRLAANGALTDSRSQRDFIGGNLAGGQEVRRARIDLITGTRLIEDSICRSNAIEPIIRRHDNAQHIARIDFRTVDVRNRNANTSADVNRSIP
jgi:hypothetical protein